MASIPLPALAINPPPNPTDQFSKIVALKNLLQQSQLRQQLAPGELQGQQLQNQAMTQENQQREIQLNDQKLLMGIYAKHASGGSATPSSDDGSTPTGPRQSPSVDLQSNIGSMVQDAINSGVSPQGIQSLLAAQKSQLDVANQAATLDKSQREARVAQNNAIWNGAETLRQIPEGSPERFQAYQNLLPNLQQQGVDVSRFPQTSPTNAQLDALEAPLGMINGAIELGTKRAQEASAQQAADIVNKLSTPEALASPGAQAAIQEKINDPSTKPSDVPRLQALLPKAAAAQQNALTQKTRELAAQQAISQGDPDAAGQLLASRALTIDELKLRNATPQFMERAVTAAQKYDPTFKAPEAAAQGKIAAAPANQQFFGNTDSLLVRGGTLDQLASAGSQLPAGKIPIFNKYEQLASAAIGNTPTSRYAAAVLGVADDYAKVMGGTQGSDTSRAQVLNILKGSQSPQQLAASVDQIRQQVNSQREGRIGTNPYLRDMYPNPNPQANAPKTGNVPPGATHIVPGRDGKNHYTNAQGTVDLGIAP